MSSPSRVHPLSRLILCILAITVPLAQGAESADISDGADLARQVAALPTAQPWQRLKQATLNWALEDARAAETQGFAERSAATLADVRTLLAQEIGKAKAPEANYFPAIPGFASNPVAQDAVKRLTTLIISPDTFVKGPVGDDITTKGSGTHNAIMRAEEGLQLVQALCHPQSPFLDDPRIIAPLFRRMEYSYEYFVPGNNRVADFAISPPAAQMYLLFTAVHPDLILPSRRAAWEQALRVNSDGIMALREKIFAANAPGTSYVNADIKYITALAYAGLLFHEPRYLKAAEAGVRLQETALYGDGGFAYIYWQNECFTYHGIAVSELARLWQVTGWPMAKQLIERTRTYYPLSIEPSGIAEFTTASAWKHNWSGAKPGRDALITAAFTNDPHNQRLALMDLGKGDLWSASFWRPDITPAPSPDQYLVHDRNIDGPRGRFGAWSFSGTARDYHDDPRGKSTYVGCVATVPAAVTSARKRAR